MNEKYEELRTCMLADIARRARCVLDIIEGKEADVVNDEKLVTVCQGLANAAKAFEIVAVVGVIVPWVLESNGCEDE